MKKKLFASLLVAVMLLSLAACGQKNDDVVKDDGANEMVWPKVGLVDDIIDYSLHEEHKQEKHKENDVGLFTDLVNYSNLSAAMLAMEKGEVGMLSLSKSSADYVAAHNDKFQILALTEGGDGGNISHFSMMTTDSNTELYDILDSGIKQLKENGTLDKLIEENLKAYITSDPIPAEMPKFDGAKTYKIAITGDRPPMDFVAADGKAAGFNVALLTEIANIAQVNFEIVQIDSGARLTSLASGAVGAVFWTESIGCYSCGEVLSSAPEGTVITEPYFSDSSVLLTLK